MSLRSNYHLESVERVIRLLDCFSAETPELRLTDLSNALDMPKVQVLRVASTLEAGGYLVRDSDTKRYRLGIRLFHLGMLVQNQIDLRRVVHPFLQDLVQRARETVRLVVPDDDGPICLDLVESPHGTRVFAQLGMRMPWNAGTSPKVLLAFLPNERRERILSLGSFKQYTPHTKTNPDALREEILAIRQVGYHVSSRDLDEDALGVSAPIFDHNGQVIGTINVSGPVSRLSKKDIDGLIEMVVDATHEISLQLGFQPSVYNTQMVASGG